MKSVKLDGMSFYDNGNGYFYNSWRRMYLHRYIWEKENGPIPQGYDVHHIDHDKNNNSINNLTILTRKEHLYLHEESLSEEQKEKRRKHMLTTVHEAAKEWHKSEKGKEWHKNHYNNCKYKLQVIKQFKCQCCDDIFEAIDNGANKFCSNKCKSKYRRLKGLDLIDKHCEYCGTLFKTNKHKKSKCCSRSCANRLRGKTKRMPNLRE